MHIHWTKKAALNLEFLEHYIAKDNPTAAIETVLKIFETIELLKEHPSMGRAGRVFGTRELIISDTPYLVPYSVKKDRIYILRVLHGAMEWPTSL